MRSRSVEREVCEDKLWEVQKALIRVNGILDQPSLENRAVYMSQKKGLEEQRETLSVEIDRLTVGM